VDFAAVAASFVHDEERIVVDGDSTMIDEVVLAAAPRGLDRQPLPELRIFAAARASADDAVLPSPASFEISPQIGVLPRSIRE